MTAFAGEHSEPSKTPRQGFWARHPADVAPDLIGWTLLFNGAGGRIVEVEAYHREDPASHSFSGPTPRNAVMFGPQAHLYVYLSYGIHWCVNVVCWTGEPGGAVLIRALEPTHGLAEMSARRGTNDPRALCSGPGKLCQALAVTREHNGLPLDRAPFELVPGEARGVVSGPRIGITKAVDVPWRFGEPGSPFLSRPFRKA